MLDKVILTYLNLQLMEEFALQSDGQRYRFTICGLERWVTRRGDSFWEHVEDRTLEDIVYGRDSIYKLATEDDENEEKEL